MDREAVAYQIQQQEESFLVLDEAGQRVCTCRSLASAQQYASWLNQAYRRGYKSGYHVAKRSVRGNEI